MKQHILYITASVLAIVLAIGIAVRITLQKNDFSRTVQDALETSEGYDEKFIDMVNRLEEELAMRASFGYKGQKDPMTGKVRSVVLQHAPVRSVRPEVKKDPKEPDKEPEVVVDPVKLTAIIFDDEKNLFTAVIMDEERSYSVEMGDRVRDRTITRITNETVFMESPTTLYKYDIYGKSAIKQKDEQ